MPNSPVNQVMASLLRINDECKKILSAMDNIETQNEPCIVCGAYGGHDEGCMMVEDTCPHGIAVDANLPCTRCEYERRRK